MAYASFNFKTKTALKEAVKAGKKITVYHSHLALPKADGIEYLEGPHYPEPHSWYAKVTLKDGLICKVQ